VTRVLITGAGGYLGGRLVQAMSERQVELRTLVRELAPGLDVQQTLCDLAAEDAAGIVRAACEGVDAVVHLAGEDEVLAAREPARALASTVVATERVAEAVAEAGIPRLVYLSTVHVYGARITPDAVLEEEMRAEPRSAYAISRLASEHLAAGLARAADQLVVYRLTNSVGAPHHPAVDRWTLVCNDLCRQGATQGRLRLRSSGTQWRDFLAVSWVCSALCAAAGVGEVAVPAGTYNLGSGQPVTVRALAGLIQDAFERYTGNRPPLEAPDPEPEPPGPYYVSTARLSGCGLSSPPPLSEAVAETVRFCLEHEEQLR
jgi:UDP-glucose 4-epimerase